MPKHLLKAALTASLVVFSASSAMADKLSLNAISNYLNGIKTAESPFTQINSDGTISTGTISLSRPGRARFDYNPPEKALVMANNGTVVILDRKINGTAETYPLNQTPLSIILAANVNLAQANMVTAHGYDGTATIVTAQDPRNPEYGSIQLKFTDSPTELRQWIITDSGGSQTTVILGGLEKKSLPRSLFNIRDEIDKLN